MPAPTGLAALPPSTLRVCAARPLLVRDRGRVLVGGSPFRLIRLRPAGSCAFLRWRDGGLIGDGTARRRLGRRLLDTGILVADPAPTSATDVAIVVPVRDRAQELARCLTALRSSDGATAEIVVVDDGSTDGDRVRAVAATYGARLLRHSRCRGPAAARNTGLRGTGTPFVAFVDSDVVVDDGWLQRLRGQFQDPLVGAAAPRVLALGGRDGSPIAGYEQRRSSLDMGAAAASAGVGRPVAYVPSTAVVVRREAMSTRGFDETLTVGEDVDLCWRLGAEGWRVAYDPAATVKHEHRVRALPFLRRRWDYAGSIGPLARRHPAALPALRLDPATAMASTLLMLGRPRPAVAVVAVAVARRRATLTGRCDRPTLLAAELTALSCANAARSIAHAIRRAWSPALLVLAAGGPSSRGARLALLAASVVKVAEDRPQHATDAALALVDDAIAGFGTWAGCWRARTVAPLLPRSTRAGRGQPSY